jgi:hypothetical protein
MRALFWSSIAALGIGCTPQGTPEAGPSSAASTISPALPAPALCCKDYEEIKRLDGKRVTITGVYRPAFVRKQIGPLPETDPEGNPASTVSLDTAEKQRFMLEIYYSARGKRAPEEIQRFSGMKVRVTGTMHARTPSQSDEGGGELQTMISPYIGEIERIEAAGL